MTRGEFLAKLKEALSGELDSYAVQSHLDYYNEYISEEMAHGRAEAEVLEELGDPWWIAKSLLESPNTSHGGQVYESYTETGNEGRRTSADRFEEEDRHIRVIGFDVWWKKLLLIGGIVGVIALILALISGIISLVAPIVVPILVITLVVRFFQNRR